MPPKLWLPVIIVFFFVLVFAGMRLGTEPITVQTKPSSPIHADPNWTNRLLQRIAGPPTAEEDHKK